MVIQAEFPRRYLPEGKVFERWEDFGPSFDELRDRPLNTTSDIERWLTDYSELAACLEELGTARYVAMTCHTDDPKHKAAYLDFVENIEPRCKPRFQELDLRYVQVPAAKDLPPRRYRVLDRTIRTRVELFREENIPLQTGEARLMQQHQEISGAQMVEFDGREQTLQQLALYAERTDRAIRQAAWEAETQRRLQDAETLESLFEQLLDLRQKMATNAGFADYRAYMFKAKLRFDYTPEDCLRFHEAVEKTAVPVYRAMHATRKEALGVDPLRPWDLDVDVRGRAPLRPFANADELCDRATQVFTAVDPELGAQFTQMRERGYLDLESRKGKAPGGYQATFEASRHPFIFMNAVGVQQDVSTLLHEGGHAFHALAARHDPLLSYRSSPIEFAEVASFGMELLTLDHLDAYYTGEDLARARRGELEGIVGLFPWVATIDAFQHFLYTHPGHTRQERRQCWLSLRERFGGLADFSGYEAALALSWQRQLHLFQVPFYYIEYGIAKLGALQVWRNARRDRRSAIRAYREALALGGSRPLPNLFAAAGTVFDFSEKTLGPLMTLVQDELESLPV